MDGGYWIYAVLVLVTVPPMVPNSALLAGAGALAASGGGLSVPLLLCLPLVGATLGDLAVFSLGRRARGPTMTWLSRDPRRLSTMERLSGLLDRYGVPSVIAVRFVPTGRGVGGLTAGVVGFPVRSFLLGAAVAEAIFVSYTVGLGYVGGRLATDGAAPFVIGPAVSLLVAGTVLMLQRKCGRQVDGRALEGVGGQCAGPAEPAPHPGTRRTPGNRAVMRSDSPPRRERPGRRAGHAGQPAPAAGGGRAVLQAQLREPAGP